MNRRSASFSKPEKPETHKQMKSTLMLTHQDKSTTIDQN